MSPPTPPVDVARNNDLACYPQVWDVLGAHTQSPAGGKVALLKDFSYVF